MNLMRRFDWIFIAYLLVLASCDQDPAVIKKTSQKKTSEASMPKPAMPGDLPTDEQKPERTEEVWSILKQNDQAHRSDIIAELLKIEQLPAEQKKQMVNRIWQREQDEGIFPIQSLVLGRIDPQVVKIFSTVLPELPADQRKAFIEAKIDNISLVKQLTNREPSGNINDLPVRLTNNRNFDDSISLAQLLSLFTLNGIDLANFSKKETMQAVFSTLLFVHEEQGIVKVLQDMSLPENQNNAREWRYWFIGWSLENGNRAKAMKSVIDSPDIKDDAKRFLLETLFHLALVEDIRETVMTKEPEDIKTERWFFSQKLYANDAALKRFSRLFDNDYGLKSKALLTIFKYPGTESGSLLMLALQAIKYSDLYAKKSLNALGAEVLRRRAAALVRTVTMKLRELIPNKTDWEKLVRHKNADDQPDAIHYLEKELKIDNKAIGDAKSLLDI